MALKITGTAVYVPLEGGFWSIETSDSKYIPINMPEQLKSEGAQIKCTIRIRDDISTIYSWGIPCQILAFGTLKI